MGNLHKIEADINKANKAKAAAKLQGFLRIAGISLGVVAGTYLLYKALKRRFDQCVKTCKGNKVCMYKCRINYQKSLIATLKKNESELKRGGKLTPKKSKAINSAIKKSEEK